MFGVEMFDPEKPRSPQPRSSLQWVEVVEGGMMRYSIQLSEQRHN
jgi:hypothetical protein